MKIKSIKAVSADFLRPDKSDDSVSKESRPSWNDRPVANPMTRYPRYAKSRPSWMPNWENLDA